MVLSIYLPVHVLQTLSLGRLVCMKVDYQRWRMEEDLRNTPGPECFAPQATAESAQTTQEAKAGA